jgi:hypothetical protein
MSRHNPVRIRVPQADEHTFNVPARDRKVMHRRAPHLVPINPELIEFQTPNRGVLFDRGNRGEDVLKTPGVISHTGIASSRTLGRIRPFRPSSLATSTRQLLQFAHECGVSQQAATGFKLHQQIQVTVRTILAASDGTENSNVPRTVA